ncbi:MAG TPA: hypothetical protein VMS18_28050 [Candidatus Binatia bacterium]|nr:hypothetical protein [Candidatus Binatia bacterium]
MGRLNRKTVVCVPLLLAFVMVPSSFAADTGRSKEEDNIREAVFRHQFQHNASGQKQQAHAYCLSIRLADKDADPTDEFMKRFSGHMPPVRKASQCRWSKGEVVENHTGKPALIFSISNITWISDTEVTVGGGYEEANLSSSGNTYTVKKNDGKWTVSQDRMNWISKNELSLP